MAELSRGANTTISGDTLGVRVQGAGPGAVDLMAFQLSVDRVVRSDDDFIFFNQPVSPEGAVRLTAGDRLLVELSTIPPAVHVLAVAVALADAVPGALADVAGLGVTAGSITAPAFGLTNERAAVLVEVYRRGTEWKIRNVSAGWTEGLPALVRAHGVSVDEEPEAGSPGRSAAPATAAPAAQSKKPAPGAAATVPMTHSLPAAMSAGVDLGKVSGKLSLTKGQRVSITKPPVVVASISWPPATDYDVYALVRYHDGHVETVSQFGTVEDRSYTAVTADGAVRHGGDVRRGAAKTATERIEIRLNDSILAVVPVVYSAQSNGAGSFRKYKVSMTIDGGSGTSITVDAQDGHKSPFVFTCVPGIIVNTGADVSISALEQYSRRGSERRPVLKEDLTVAMDEGPVNFFK